MKNFWKNLTSPAQRQKGFTLIELLIVIAVLGILAAVAIPQVIKFIGSGRVSAANTEVGLVNVAVQAAMADAAVGQLSAAGVVSPSSDITVTGTYSVNAYIQGGTPKLTGTYSVGTIGFVTNAAFPGGPTWNSSVSKFE